MYNSEKIGAIPRVIEGSSLPECQSALWEKYGESFHILDWKTSLKPGILGFFQKEVVTVNYIVEDKFERFSTPTQNQLQMKKPSYSQAPISVSSVRGGGVQDFTASRDNLLKQQLGNNSSVTNVLQVAQLTKKLEKIDEKLESLSLNQQSATREESPVIKKINELLQANEFSQSFIKRINDRICKEFTVEDSQDFEKVQAAVVDWIGESISIAPEFSKKNKKDPHVIIIGGPTGAGKTTTIARMAVNLVRSAKQKKTEIPSIKMLTVDKWRLGAYEQLLHFAQAMNMSVDKAESTEDSQELLDSYKNEKKAVDYILIDTSGYSPNDYENIGKLRSLIDVKGLQSDIYLAMMAGSKASDIENIIRNYESFDYRSVIITKCDETSAFGNVLSVLYEKNKPVSLITDGQDVLHSLRKASAESFLMKLTGFQVNKEHIKEKFSSENENA